MVRPMDIPLQSRAAAFAAPAFLKKLTMSHADAERLFAPVDWCGLCRDLAPTERRVSCAASLDAFRPLLDRISPEPAEGWLSCAYETARSLLYPAADAGHTAAQRDGALCFLQFLQVLFDLERTSLPFDLWLDFELCTEEELSHSGVAEEYRRFLRRFREEYIYELLRLGREVTPFQTLDHIAGVHHVAMQVARAFRSAGGLIDLGLISGAALGHDLGKFGCKPGERVAYLHYYYTDQWFTRRGLTALGHIAANHSVWDLEIENLSSESLALVYADFRVKQIYDDQHWEIPRLYSLQEAFDVILSKLDDVDDAKRMRYRYVYAKLRDFEDYLISFGVDTTLRTPRGTPPAAKNAALLEAGEVVPALRRTAVDHNIRLMHRLGHEQLFGNTLEAARGEKDPARLQAYVSIFEEYFTYWNASQKQQTLEFLYELLMMPDGNIRRRAAALIGRILAAFRLGYQKEPPADAPPDPEEDLPFQLWAEYLARLIDPDRRLTPRQISMIRYQAKTAADALLMNCSDADAPRFAGELFRHYRRPELVEADAAFALLDTVLSLPLERVSGEDLHLLTSFAVWWLKWGGLPQKAAALRLFRHLLTALDPHGPDTADITAAVAAAECQGSTPLLFLQAHLGAMLGLDVSAQRAVLDRQDAVSSVFLDNLKSATPWVLKAVGVEYLLDQVEQGDNANVLHIATHFSNLMKVSENIVVRRMAGASLLAIAPVLTPDRRNEVAVELSKVLETGQTEISQYIPAYLGQFALWLTPRELDEIVDQMQLLLSSANTVIVAAALATVGAMLEHYGVYAGRFREPQEVLKRRWQRLAGLLLKGLASYRQSVRQEALQILGERIFGSQVLSRADKAALFTLMAKKILFLLGEQPEQELSFFYTAAALSHIYRFIVSYQIECGAFSFRAPAGAAFFPGTFDPFSLSHKGIVQAIRNLGMEVYLAVDEFSWSKKTQPSLVRRQIVSMSVADEFDVYLFPHDIPVNLATPEDLDRLRQVFAGRELYLAVGSDVVANASSYRAAPSPGSVHSLNHIVFRRSSGAEGQEIEADLSRISGRVIQLQLPTHLEDISSTRIRENIDLGRDISSLIDPVVQDFIYRNSLYLREPQYKQILRAGDLVFSHISQPNRMLWEEVTEALLQARAPAPQTDPRDGVCLLRSGGPRSRLLGFLTLRTVNSGSLYEALEDPELADFVRRRTAGKIRLLTSLTVVPGAAGGHDVGQLLMTEALSRAISEDCGYAVWYGPASEDTLDLLERQGFVRAELPSRQPLLLVDMRSPSVLLQNIPTTLKEPFSSDPAVLKAVKAAHRNMQRALTGLYPGSLILSLNAEVIYHRLVRKIADLNGVRAEPTVPRVLGPKMCVPFGKILRGNAIPNTVTKTIHTDKVFAQDLRSFTIESFPGYAPLESQIRTIHSFRRPVILVDDLLHSGTRINALDPLFRQEGVVIDQVLVGLLSGRGRDLIAAKGLSVDSVYFIPNMESWFVESTMYPFIGGDTVGHDEPSVPGLTPAVNLILPYAFPRFYKNCDREAVFRFSCTCLENARDILLALESTFRERYARNLTLSRLSEAVILPLSPDKGSCMHYDPSLPASVFLQNDLKMLLRMRNVLE
ncbi:nicotinate-nicotinamide nucleotide adenylyltransferase [Oscillibacter valericigenes]|uniref:nicotinate-nicotinamide nucleotide adenylyltransferase n=1 Tax=Oscillibacter valericigenes TaxID=351091 RepID=UPI001FAEEE0F|nr:cytidyltransferase-related domain protein [Oscillibacter valericigenes]